MTANNNLVLTEFSSLKRLAESQTTFSNGGLYQQLAWKLVSDTYVKHDLRDLGERLVVLAEHAHAFRQMDALEDVSQVLMNSPVPRVYKAVGQYYQALCIHRFGRGNLERAAHLIETVAEDAPPRYRVRAMQSLGSNSIRKGDYAIALALFREAARFAHCNRLYDAYATLGTQKMVAVINSEDGNHGGALVLLENLLPLARTVSRSHPHVYYDYMNSLAVELCEVGRLEEAANFSQIVLTSPFALAYPEWRETSNDIAARGRRTSRATIAFSQRVNEPGNKTDNATTTAEAGRADREAITATGNLVSLPLARRDSQAPALPGKPQPLARVIEFPLKKATSDRQDEDELGLSEKGRIVADELYEMFMATLQHRPVDSELVHELYEVFVKKWKKV